MTGAAAIASYREGFAPGPGVHLNNAGVSPMCRHAAGAIASLAGKMVSGGSLGMDETLEAYEATREQIAWLTGASVDHVSHMQTCAVALSQVAFGIPLAEGDEIVRWDQEYPSNGYPWHAVARDKGAKVVIVDSEADLALDTDKLVSAITERTKVVTVSWVQFSTGAMTDLKPVADRCKEVGAWCVVDAIQGLGIVPFDMKALGVDAVCGGTHKWLAGPVGHGFLALADGRRDQLRPLMHGAITYGTPDDAIDPARAPRTDPHRFEPGTPLMLGAAGCGAAIAHARTVGIEGLNEAALDLSDRLIAGLRDRDAHILSKTEGRPRSPIVTFIPRQGTEPVVKALRERHFAIAARAGGIRVAPHAFNTTDDIDALLAVVDDVKG
jgi:cysteine desulfurase/selenocysteine lyase